MQGLLILFLRRFGLHLASIASLIAASPAYAAVVRGPYLQIVTPDSVTVAWRTDRNSSADSVVNFGESIAARIRSASGIAVVPDANDEVLDHVVRIEALEPDTKYFYDFGTASEGVAGGGTEEFFFRTAPAPSSPGPFVTWFVGDSGNGSSQAEAVRDAMVEYTGASAPELFLHVGDMAYETGTDAQLTERFFSLYEDVLTHVALWTTPGNHEMDSASSSTARGPYYEAFVLPAEAQAGGVASGTESFYSFDYANVHFISLESTEASVEPAAPMIEWLRADLAARTQHWTVAFFHHPPYSKGSHDSDDADDSEGRLTTVREQVVPILEEAGVDLVVTGHSHVYERSYLIDGAHGFGSAPNFATPPFDALMDAGVILDGGSGAPNGDGPYVKTTGAHRGTVYVVTGHGGRVTSLNGLHPVMYEASTEFGSGLLSVDGDVLEFRNLSISGEVTDVFSIAKATATTTTVAITTTSTQPTTTTSITPPVCGDGVLSPGEQCDDGDIAWSAGSGCNASCETLACGDPDDSGAVVATDALFILRTAVGLSACDLCICDVQASGAVSVNDALAALAGRANACATCEF